MSVERVKAGPQIATLLARRWSPRAFDCERPVLRATLEQMLEAARWAPSCFNGQPWRFAVAERDRNPEVWSALLDCLVEGNRIWARAAPVLAVIAASDRFPDGTANAWSAYDAGAAALAFALQGAALGLAVHQMGGYDRARVAQVLRMPGNCTPISVAAIGHPGDPAALAPNLRAREDAARSRLDVAEFVHWGVFA